MQPDVSILIPTYNRARTLADSLDALALVDRTGIELEVVVVNNNSTDDTEAVVRAREDKLPIRYRFEPRPGKSIALNGVLDEGHLGRILVFIDDDVFPRVDWLQEIVASCEKFPDWNVFGGKISLVWPEVEIPGWSLCQDIQLWAFSFHDLGDEPLDYPEWNYPAGPNFWVRGAAVEQHRIRFDAAVGPRPKGYRVMGAETSFLRALELAGEKPMYYPAAELGHLVQESLLTESSIKKRAFRWGRQMPNRGLAREELLRRRPLVWRAIRWTSLARHALRYLGAQFLPRDRRVVKSVAAITGMGYDYESLRLAGKGPS